MTEIPNDGPLAGVTVAPAMAAPPEEAELRLAPRAPEDVLAFLVFWLLAFTVFLQFFTRYVLNNSLPWTEEGARYLLVAVAFLGGGLAVRRRAHIAVEFVHNYLPLGASNAVLLLADLVCIGFYAYSAYLAWLMVGLMGTQQMAVIDLPMSWLYAAVLAGLCVMSLRSVQSAWLRFQLRRR
ncbi:TRAP transporter small permease [Azospirillum sp.]|uniref:TRAP transporter small permease n=1 Tax=Azospirillum sp. TaxID=34012 RepID=UPI003D7576DC